VEVQYWIAGFLALLLFLHIVVQAIEARKERLNPPDPIPERFNRGWIFQGPVGGIAVDAALNDIAVRGRKEWTILDVNEIASCELVVAGRVIQKTSGRLNLGRAVVGGVLLGPVGAAIGGLSGKTTTTTAIDASMIFLRITTSRMDSPVFEVHFRHFDSFLTKWSDEATAKGLGNEWLARIQSAIAQKHKYDALQREQT
jgi:hypothetical protein